MRKIGSVFIIAVLLLTVSVPVNAKPAPPVVNSHIAVLMDFASGEVIYAKNQDQRWDPASLTKIMTMYLVFQGLEAGQLNLTDQVRVSEAAWRTIGSRMFIEVGKDVPLEELIKGITIISGNDASVAAAEHIGGSVPEFVRLMNNKAAALNLPGTNFVNPHGLADPNQYTTGLDMARLARAYIKRFPHSLEYHSTRSYTFDKNMAPQRNRNGLLDFPGIDGLKTGRVLQTWNLIATGKRDDYRLIAVIMGAANEEEREREAMALLNYGFNNFRAHSVGEKGKDFGRIRVYKGKQNWINAVLPENLSITVPKEASVNVKVELPEYLVAPLAAGAEAGKIVVEAGGQTRTFPLIAQEAVPKGNFFRVFFDTISLMLRNLLK
ncbi:MAG: D-alanyl-D-alanine carboxypeptidase [Syntrophomonadaceae bacterium]|nr:D-alanyl-D-alanine carboxypeptidase [Syntrophomonadaceae bacterium]